jgi:hypothetical protein
MEKGMERKINALSEILLVSMNGSIVNSGMALDAKK